MGCRNVDTSVHRDVSTFRQPVTIQSLGQKCGYIPVQRRIHIMETHKNSQHWPKMWIHPYIETYPYFRNPKELKALAENVDTPYIVTYPDFRNPQELIALAGNVDTSVTGEISPFRYPSSTISLGRRSGYTRNVCTYFMNLVITWSV